MSKKNARSLFVLFLLVLSLITASCGSTSPSTSASTEVPATAEASTEVPATTEAAVELVNSCEFDPNVNYSITGATVYGFYCDEENGYVKILLSGDITIIGRVWANNYRPFSEDVEIYYQFDQIDPTDNAVIKPYNNCQVNGMNYSYTPSVATVTAIQDFEVICTDTYPQEIQITARFQIRPISDVVLPQPRYDGEIIGWDQVEVGQDLVLCSSFSSIPVYDIAINGDFSIGVYKFLPGCIPVTMLDPETYRIQYEGYSPRVDHGAAYVVNPVDVLGGYPFLALDELLVGKRYILCHSTLHNPEFTSLTVGESVFSNNDCFAAVYQGFEQGQVPSQTTLWTVNNMIYKLNSVTGAYVAP